MDNSEGNPDEVFSGTQMEQCEDERSSVSRGRLDGSLAFAPS